MRRAMLVLQADEFLVQSLAISSNLHRLPRDPDRWALILFFLFFFLVLASLVVRVLAALTLAGLGGLGISCLANSTGSMKSIINSVRRCLPSL